MSITAASPDTVTDFDALLQRDSAPISRQPNTALFDGVEPSLVRRITSALGKLGGHPRASQAKLRRFSIDVKCRAMHTVIAQRAIGTPRSPRVARRFDPSQHRQCMTQPVSVTELIKAADNNVPQAVNKLFDVLYNDLRRVANARLHANGRAADMSPTVLVHETYERLVQLQELRVSDRKQFFTYASTVMRSVIVDMARARLADRRGGGVADIPINTVLEASLASPLDDSVVQINDALEQLAAVEPRLAQVVEMRYFGGLSMMEIAEAMDVTERTVARDWTKARSLLAAMLSS